MGNLDILIDAVHGHHAWLYENWSLDCCVDKNGWLTDYLLGDTNGWNYLTDSASDLGHHWRNGQWWHGT